MSRRSRSPEGNSRRYDDEPSRLHIPRSERGGVSGGGTGGGDNKHRGHPSGTVPPAGANLIIVPNGIPADTRALVDHVATLVKDGGPILEQNIYRIAGGDANPKFRFMTAPYQNEVACYYRWRLYSLLQGDTLKRWRTDPYQTAYPSQVWWVPPPLPGTKRLKPGVPRNLITDDNAHLGSDDEEPETASRAMDLYGELIERGISPDKVPRRRHWFELLKAVNGPDRVDAIGDATVFAIEHSQYAHDVLDSILDGIDFSGLGDAVVKHIQYRAKHSGGGDGGGDETALAKDVETRMKRAIARLFLLNDIYANRFAKPKTAASSHFAPSGILKANAFILPRLFHQASAFVARVFAAESVAAGKPTAYPGTTWRTEFGSKSPVWTIVGWLRELWALWRDSGSVDEPTIEVVCERFGFMLLAAAASSNGNDGEPMSPVAGPTSRLVHV